MIPMYKLISAQNSLFVDKRFAQNPPRCRNSSWAQGSPRAAPPRLTDSTVGRNASKEEFAGGGEKTFGKVKMPEKRPAKPHKH